MAHTIDQFGPFSQNNQAKYTSQPKINGRCLPLSFNSGTAIRTKAQYWIAFRHAIMRHEFPLTSLKPGHDVSTKEGMDLQIPGGSNPSQKPDQKSLPCVHLHWPQDGDPRSFLLEPSETPFLSPSAFRRKRQVNAE